MTKLGRKLADPPTNHAAPQRNRIYTGVTRGNKLVALVELKAVTIAVKNVSGRRRWTKLKAMAPGHTHEDPFVLQRSAIGPSSLFDITKQPAEFPSLFDAKKKY